MLIKRLCLIKLVVGLVGAWDGMGKDGTSPTTHHDMPNHVMTYHAIPHHAITGFSNPKGWLGWGGEGNQTAKNPNACLTPPNSRLTHRCSSPIL